MFRSLRHSTAADVNIQTRHRNVVRSGFPTWEGCAEPLTLRRVWALTKPHSNYYFSSDSSSMDVSIECNCPPRFHSTCDDTGSGHLVFGGLFHRGWQDDTGSRCMWTRHILRHGTGPPQKSGTLAWQFSTIDSDPFSAMSVDVTETTSLDQLGRWTGRYAQRTHLRVLQQRCARHHSCCMLASRSKI